MLKALSFVMWGSFQLTIMGFFVFIASQEPEQNIGLGLFVGFVVAAFLTGVLSHLFGWIGRLASRLHRRVH